MTVPVDRLKVRADQVLAAAVAGMTAAGIPVPDRRYVVPTALVAHDCEQVVVALDQLLPNRGDAAESRPTSQRCIALAIGVFTVHVVRCVPVVASQGQQVVTPTPAAIDASAVDLLRDPLAVWNGVLAAYRAGTFGHARELVFEQATPLGPNGGLAAWVIRFRLGLMDV